MSEQQSTGRPATGIVLVAAGSGTRLGAGLPKAFVELEGATILERSLAAFRGLPGAVELVLVVPADRVEEAGEIAERALAGSGVEVSCAVGGETRQASVGAGIAALSDRCDVILVHDAARCLASSTLVERVAGAVRATGKGIIPALPVVDTVKRVGPESGGAEPILETVDRSELRAVQTPQGFPAELLRAAYADPAADHTDDAALVACLGGEVATIPGEDAAFKVTRPTDLERAADAIARAEGSGEQRAGEQSRTAAAAPLVGIGVDVHAFDPSCELWLAGLHWPGEVGLSGHSDGDAVSHAICDALLSAAGLGDIGGMFGTDDPELEGAHGEVFLRRTRERLEANGFAIGNVAVQLVSQKPRFSPRREEANAVLSEIVGAPVRCSATTSDRLGFTGREEGVLAYAVAVVTRKG